MPIRWYGPADTSDPTYRHYERIVNLCLHGGLFAAVNSGLWFVQRLRHPWQHLSWLTLAWGLAGCCTSSSCCGCDHRPTGWSKVKAERTPPP